MKIHELHVENIKRVKVVDITPKDNVVILEGKNAQGKTSVLDSVAMVLGGKKLIPNEPVRKDEEKAVIKVIVGDYEITRNWTSPTQSYLKITTKEGMKPSNPQGFLDGLIGNISFDPHEFVRMEKSKKAEMLKKIMKLDLTELDQRINDVYEARRLKRKSIDGMIAELRNYGDLPEPTGMSYAGAEKQLNEAKEFNEIILNARKTNSQLTEDIDNIKEKIEELESLMREKISEASKLNDKIKEKLIDIEPLKKNFALAETELRNQSYIERRDALRKEVKKEERELVLIEKKLTNSRVEKDERIKESKAPIKGLTVGDDGVQFNGIDIDQISLAEQIKVSMAIAMAENPQIKVILIRDGSLLDKESKKTITELAIKKDFQVWIERVAEKKGSAIYIEDGKVV